MSRHARRTDDNHTRIATGLRACGAWVWSTAPLGDGFPDLLVWYRGRYHLLEIKNPEQVPSARELTPKEIEFHRMCPGPIGVVETLSEALAAIGGKCSPTTQSGEVYP